MSHFTECKHFIIQNGSIEIENQFHQLHFLFLLCKGNQYRDMGGCPIDMDGHELGKDVHTSIRSDNDSNTYITLEGLKNTG